MKLPITDIKTLQTLLPQKPPFLMVDSLFEIGEKTAVSGLNISGENLLCDGEYFSEAGIIENMAQTIALHSGYQGWSRGEASPKPGVLGAVKSFELFGLPSLNTGIRTHIEILHDVMGIQLSEAVTKNETGKILAKATIKTASGNQ